MKTTDGDSGLITVGAFNQLVFGLLIVLVLTFEPQGLLGLYDRLKSRLTGRRRTSALAAEPQEIVDTRPAERAGDQEGSIR
jgi:hypothetical protein